MYDCIIIGAGISGCSLAFELSKYSGKVLWLEKNNDVADETTKANSAIIHADLVKMMTRLLKRYISVVWKMVLKISVLLSSLSYQKWNQI